MTKDLINQRLIKARARSVDAQKAFEASEGVADVAITATVFAREIGAVQELEWLLENSKGVTA